MPRPDPFPWGWQDSVPAWQRRDLPEQSQGSQPRLAGDAVGRGRCHGLGTGTRCRTCPPGRRCQPWLPAGFPRPQRTAEEAAVPREPWPLRQHPYPSPLPDFHPTSASSGASASRVPRSVAGGAGLAPAALAPPPHRAISPLFPPRSFRPSRPGSFSSRTPRRWPLPGQQAVLPPLLREPAEHMCRMGSPRQRRHLTRDRRLCAPPPRPRPRLPAPPPRRSPPRTPPRHPQTEGLGGDNAGCAPPPPPPAQAPRLRKRMGKEGEGGRFPQQPPRLQGNAGRNVSAQPRMVHGGNSVAPRGATEGRRSHLPALLAAVPTNPRPILCTGAGAGRHRQHPPASHTPAAAGRRDPLILGRERGPCPPSITLPVPFPSPMASAVR